MQRLTIISIVALLSVAACSDHTADQLLAPSQVTRVSAPVLPSVVTGDKQGAFYALHVPANWNGDVVYYAHGIIPAGAPIALPTGDGFPAVRDALKQLGFAVAYSSFAENGWAEKDGVLRTHQLRELFIQNYGQPSRSYLMGTSLGGLVAENLAERYPSQYDGTLAMCAPLGGAQAEMKYIGDVRVLFDLFYPGVVPGNVLNVPLGIDINTQVLGPAQAAIINDPTGLGVIARMKQTPIAGNNPTELVTSVLNALAYDALGVNDLLSRTNGKAMYGNSTTKYDAVFPGLLPASLLGFVNGNVGRFTASEDALDYLDRYYLPSGNLAKPTITLHTTRDPLVPYFHEARFADAVGASGQTSRLLQRSVDQYGHCTFTTSDMVDAFTALTGWVQTGVKPSN